MYEPRIHRILGEVTLALRERGVEGWLLYDHANRNKVAERLFGPAMRELQHRFVFWMPATDGMPLAIAHTEDAPLLDELPGDLITYTGWGELLPRLERSLPVRGTILLEHATVPSVPELSIVDEGTLALVRSRGAKVASSIDLANEFAGPLEENERESVVATVALLGEVAHAFTERLRSERPSDATSAKALLLDVIAAHGLVADRETRLSVGPSTGQPRSRADRDDPLHASAAIQVELWAGPPGGIVVHRSISIALGGTERLHTLLFERARRARDAALGTLRSRFKNDQRVLGYEVDRWVRAELRRAGHDRPMPHRSGSLLSTSAYGALACVFDDQEIHDIREARRGMVWSLHVGAYHDETGARVHAIIERTADGLKVLDEGQHEVRVVPW